MSGVEKKKRKIFCCNNRGSEATETEGAQRPRRGEGAQRPGGVGGGCPPSHGVKLFEFCMSNGAI